jgi:hypothetical protein
MNPTAILCCLIIICVLGAICAYMHKLHPARTTFGGKEFNIKIRDSTKKPAIYIVGDSNARALYYRLMSPHVGGILIPGKSATGLAKENDAERKVVFSVIRAARPKEILLMFGTNDIMTVVNYKLWKMVTALAAAPAPAKTTEFAINAAAAAAKKYVSFIRALAAEVAGCVRVVLPHYSPLSDEQYITSVVSTLARTAKIEFDPKFEDRALRECATREVRNRIVDAFNLQVREGLAAEVASGAAAVIDMNSEVSHNRQIRPEYMRSVPDIHLDEEAALSAVFDYLPSFARKNVLSGKYSNKEHYANR